MLIIPKSELFLFDIHSDPFIESTLSSLSFLARSEIVIAKDHHGLSSVSEGYCIVIRMEYLVVCNGL